MKLKFYLHSKLTTGFDHPNIDLIIDLRPTMSVPLHVQKWGAELDLYMPMDLI